MLNIKSKYFYGNKVSDYGLEKGYVDYGTLAKSFQCVLNNDIIAKTEGVIGYWEQISGWGDNDDYISDNGDYGDYVPEIFQWYIVDYNGATILQEVGDPITREAKSEINRMYSMSEQFYLPKALKESANNG